MTNPEFLNSPESEFQLASQEDIANIMHFAQKGMELHAWPRFPEGERVVVPQEDEYEAASSGHILWSATIQGDRIAYLFPDFYSQWQVGRHVQIEWQDEHERRMLHDGIEEIERVPASLSFLIERPEASPQPEEFIIMQRDIIGGEAQYNTERIIADEYDDYTRDVPGDTPIQPVIMRGVTSQEVQELEAIIHKLPLLIRPNN